METLGYIERKHLPGNTKNVHVYLTKAGRDLESKLVPLAVEVNKIAVKGVPAAEVATTRKVLLAVIENSAVGQAAAEGTERRIPSRRELRRLLTEA